MRSKLAADQSVADEKKQKNLPRSDHFVTSQSPHAKLAPQSILHLQRTMGNAYVRRLIEDGDHGGVQRQVAGSGAPSKSAGSTMIGHFGKSAEGPDAMSYADYLTKGKFDPKKLPNLDASSATLVAMQYYDPEWLLKKRMQLELGVLAGGLGLTMIDHFYDGKGGTYTHDVGSKLSTLAMASSTFLTEYMRIKGEVGKQLTAQLNANKGNVSAVNVGQVSVVPEKPSFGFLDGFELKGIIGGTQEVKIFVKNFSVDPNTKQWSALVRWEIYDDFGVGHDDIGRSPGLTSFWILQHLRPGHKPFVNKLIINMPMSGKL